MIQDSLQLILQQAVKKAFSDVLCEVEIEIPKEEGRGDFACTIALRLGKELKMAPRSVAEQIAAVIPENNLIEKIEIAGAGFLNLFLSPKVFSQMLAEIEQSGSAFAQQKPKTEKNRILLEFISANPTGPLTVANGRGGFGGDVLARVFRRLGYEVSTEYYINDAGNQVVTLGKSVQAAAGKIPKEEEMYQGEYVALLASAHPDAITEDAFATGLRFAELLLASEIRPAVAQMQVHFDKWFSEKSLHDSGNVEKYVKQLGQYVFEQDGALWLRTTEFGDDKDRVLKKSDGEWTYFAADIAYHADKFSRADRLIDIWGADHFGYIGRMQAATSCLHRTGDLTVLITQMVRLFRNGEEVRMSKRAGNFELMSDLIDMVGADVSRWFFVMRDLNTHLNFDLDLAQKQSDENPVYYVQYAHARIAGIVRQAGEKMPNLNWKEGDLSLLIDPTEIALIKQMAKLPDLLEDIGRTYAIHQLTTYASELATAFHRFYGACLVLDCEHVELSAARLRLAATTKEVLRIVLADLIGVKAPERM